MPYTNASEQRRYQSEWTRKRREDWIASRGGCCETCGSDDRLEVDHIDPATKEFNPREIWNRRDSIRLAELAKCQVLCYSCHKAKTREQKYTGQHGHTYYVRYKCRCDVCRTGHAESVREWRATRRAA